jgi:hypothetical protein
MHQNTITNSPRLSCKIARGFWDGEIALNFGVV